MWSKRSAGETHLCTRQPGEQVVYRHLALAAEAFFVFERYILGDGTWVTRPSDRTIFKVKVYAPW